MGKPFLFKRGGIYHLEYHDIDGRLRRVSTKCTKKNEAFSFMLKFQKEQESISKIKPYAIATTIKEYENYLEANFSKFYLAAVRIHLRRFREYVGDISISNIRMNEVEMFLSIIAKESKIKAKKYHVTINTFFNKAVVWGYIQNNPANKIKLPKSPTKAPIYITENELIEILSGESNQELRDIYFVLFHTGMRLGEIINLMWNNISLTDRVMRITNTDKFTTKGKRERAIPMNEKLFKVMSNRLPKIIDINDSNYVFTMNGRKFNGDYISKSFKKVVKNLNHLDQRIHLHSLRHSFASHLAKNSVSLYVIKELLGHRDYRTTQIYSHLQYDSLKEAVKVLEG
jgi:site-specific recombinase XerD